MLRVKGRKVDPLRERKQINALRDHLRQKYRYGEEYALIVTLGVNFGLRAGDILSLTLGQLIGTHLEITEHKTGRQRRIFINITAKDAICNFNDGHIVKYKKHNFKITNILINDGARIFSGQKGDTIQVKALHKIIKAACTELGFEGNFGTHTLRKTFAYHAYKACGDVNMVKRMFGHSSARLTKRYVGVEDYDNDEATELREDEIYSMLCL